MILNEIQVCSFKYCSSYINKNLLEDFGNGLLGKVFFEYV